MANSSRKRFRTFFARLKHYFQYPYTIHGGANPKRGLRMNVLEQTPIWRPSHQRHNREADLFYTTVEVSPRPGKSKKAILVEKEFLGKNKPKTPRFIRKFLKYADSRHDPWLQFEISSEIAKLNRTKKLGLRINPVRIDYGHLVGYTRPGPSGEPVSITVRLPRLFSKPLNVIKELAATEPWMQPEEKDIRSFIQDRDRQTEILRKNGYGLANDNFLPVRDNTGNAIAILSDFGGVVRIKKKN